jgi:hypothetical protein
VAADGSTAVARLPFDRHYDGDDDPASLAAAVALPESWGVLLVRKGGFAVARLQGAAMLEHKIGQRHVQGRTKAGGQSQQRFARRREGQARVAMQAAADVAARVLVPHEADLEALVLGGDRRALTTVLEDPRLRGLARLGGERVLDVPDPRLDVLRATPERFLATVVRPFPAA